MTPQTRQFSDNSCLRSSDDDRSLPNVSRFLAALEDGVLSSFLEDVIEAPLDPRPAAEWARYTPGDFLRQHSDQVDGRRVGIVLYLNDDPWTEECGGHFAYENQFDRVVAVPPVFNSMAMFPFRPDCGHWVSSVKEWTRYSVAIHYLDDGSRGRLRSTGRYTAVAASRSSSPQAV